MSRLKTLLQTLLWLPWTLAFNLHYFPLRTALRLPVLLCRPRLAGMRGQVKIEGPVSTGMVRLGWHSVSIYPAQGFVWDNNGGSVTFRGKCFMGSGSAISVGPAGRLDIGAGLMANAQAKIICYNSITLGHDCRLAWETMLLDTDFHALTKPDGTHTRGVAPIVLGANCWLGTGTLALKGTRLPAYTTVQARTVLSRDYVADGVGERSVIGTDARATVKAQGLWRNLADDKI